MGLVDVRVLKRRLACCWYSTRSLPIWKLSSSSIFLMWAHIVHVILASSHADLLALTPQGAGRQLLWLSSSCEPSWSCIRGLFMRWLRVVSSFLKVTKKVPRHKSWNQVKGSEQVWKGPKVVIDMLKMWIVMLILPFKLVNSSTIVEMF